MTTKGKKRKNAVPKKICLACPTNQNNEHPYSHFYVSTSSLCPDGYVPICKDCVQRLSYNEKEQCIDVQAFESVLRQIDKPYLPHVLKSSVEQYNRTFGDKIVPPDYRKKIVGIYFKNIHTLKQYKDLDYEKGRKVAKKFPVTFEDPSIDILQTDTAEKFELDDDVESYYGSKLQKFRVTNEMSDLFGQGFDKETYMEMWSKYNFLMQSYPDVTNLHTEALVSYVRYKVKEEQAIRKENVGEAKDWGKLANDAAVKAKINPSQLSKSDLQGGLNSFSELLQAMEETDEVVKILPQFRFQPNDAVDFCIWNIINYQRNLEGKAPCEYKDIYAFYDERKKEYIERTGDPFGIFKYDPTPVCRQNVQSFITLPKDYYEDSESESVGDNE